MKTLFVAWKDTFNTRAWFPVGRLDADVRAQSFRFRYIAGAKEAAEKCGFLPFDSFPDFAGDYQSAELFPFFANRLHNSNRPGFRAYLERLDLDPTVESDPIEVLAISEGRRATDTLELFPKVERAADGTFAMKFFLHGWRHIHRIAQERLPLLKVGESLGIALEVTNSATQHAVQVQTLDNTIIGWAPRYLVHDLCSVMLAGGCFVDAEVARINPPPAPPSQRVIVTFRGCWPNDFEPMIEGQFKPLVAGIAARMPLSA